MTGGRVRAVVGRRATPIRLALVAASAALVTAALAAWALDARFAAALLGASGVLTAAASSVVGALDTARRLRALNRETEVLRLALSGVARGSDVLNASVRQLSTATRRASAAALRLGADADTEAAVVLAGALALGPGRVLDFVGSPERFALLRDQLAALSPRSRLEHVPDGWEAHHLERRAERPGRDLPVLVVDDAEALDRVLRGDLRDLLARTSPRFLVAHPPGLRPRAGKGPDGVAVTALGETLTLAEVRADPAAPSAT